MKKLLLLIPLLLPACIAWIQSKDSHPTQLHEGGLTPTQYGDVRVGEYMKYVDAGADGD